MRLGLYACLGVSLLIGMVTSAKAQIIINTEFANLFKSDGTTGIGAGKIGILVADEGTTPGIIDPFGTMLTLGSYLGGTSDDRIVGITSSIASVAGFGSGFQDNFSISYTGNLGSGDKLYLLWFPTLTTMGSTVGSGISYGLYRSDVVNTASGSDISFALPAGPTFNGSLAGYLDSIAPGSGITTNDFTANYTTAVPEPSTIAVLQVAALVVLMFRRKLRRS
jgi:hypothetical protein